MTNILIFTTAFRPFIGGSELAIEEIAKRLPRLNFHIITPRSRKDLPAEEAVGNINIHRIGFGVYADKFLFPLSGFFYSRRLLPKDKRTILHAYQASHGAGAAWLAKIFFPRNILLLTLQEGKDLKRQGLFINFFRQLIIKKADYATVISRYLGEYVLKISKGLGVEIIPNGVDVESFSKKFSYGELTDLETRLGVKPDDRVIISVSRLVPKNGLDLLIRAVAVLNKDGRTSHKLILAGEGSQKDGLRKLAEELNIEDKIVFAGSVNRHDLPLYLKMSDVFVRPSRSEGLGISFLEAMAAEIPIIAPKVGGIPDFLEDGKTGLFSTFEPEDIAFKVRIVLENDKLREEIINNAVILVRERYNWDKIAEEFGKLYSKLLS